MIYQLHAGLHQDLSSQIKTTGITLLITVGMPIVAALINKADPFFLPQISSSDVQTGQPVSREGGRGGGQTSADNNDSPGAPAAAASPSQPMPVTPASGGTGSVRIGASPSTGTITSTQPVGGYGGGPAPAGATTVITQPPASPTPSEPINTTPPSTPSPGSCLCEDLQKTVNTVTQPLQPVTDTVKQTVNSPTGGLL